MTICAGDCQPPDRHYGCELRDKGLQVAPAALPTQAKRHIPPRVHDNNAWERGVKGEHRPGGTFMPYLDEKGNPIRLKRYHENEAKFKDIRRRQLESVGNSTVTGANNGN